MGMTNKEAIDILEHARLMSGFPAQIKFTFDAEGIEALEMAIKALEQIELNPSYNGVKSELEPCEDWKFYYKHGYAQARNDVLDKLRAEIENHCGLTKENHCRYCSYCNNLMGVREILEIIDKYRK